MWRAYATINVEVEVDSPGCLVKANRKRAEMEREKGRESRMGKLSLSFAFSGLFECAALFSSNIFHIPTPAWKSFLLVRHVFNSLAWDSQWLVACYLEWKCAARICFHPFFRFHSSILHCDYSIAQAWPTNANDHAIFEIRHWHT